jgi:hypothetical protein
MLLTTLAIMGNCTGTTDYNIVDTSVTYPRIPDDSKDLLSIKIIKKDDRVIAQYILTVSEDKSLPRKSNILTSTIRIHGNCWDDIPINLSKIKYRYIILPDEPNNTDESMIYFEGSTSLPTLSNNESLYIDVKSGERVLIATVDITNYLSDGCEYILSANLDDKKVNTVRMEFTAVKAQ